MTGLEIEIKLVGGHADVWRLFDDAARLREIAEALEGVTELGRLHALVSADQLSES
jgi:hypothetical protein